jgi:hypothetical protein
LRPIAIAHDLERLAPAAVLGLDPSRSRLRETVATIGVLISRLPIEERTRLVAAWADLVEQLALGPVPDSPATA